MKRTYVIVNTDTMEEKKYYSLKSACEYIDKLSNEEKRINLLGDIVYNYDYMKPTENITDYYKRMKDMIKKIWG